jgi:hypothetical protein
MNEITGRKLHRFKQWRSEGVNNVTLKNQLGTIRHSSPSVSGSTPLLTASTRNSHSQPSATWRTCKPTSCPRMKRRQSWSTVRSSTTRPVATRCST